MDAFRALGRAPGNVAGSRPFCYSDPVDRTVARVFKSFIEAERADAEYYASLSPDARVDILLDLMAQQRDLNGETDERLERVYRVVQLGKS